MRELGGSGGLSVPLPAASAPTPAASTAPVEDAPATPSALISPLSPPSELSTLVLCSWLVSRLCSSSSLPGLLLLLLLQLALPGLLPPLLHTEPASDGLPVVLLLPLSPPPPPHDAMWMLRRL